MVFQRGHQVKLLVRDWRISIHFACFCFWIACVAGVQGEGGEKLTASAKRDRWALVPYERPTIALRARIQLPPSVPLYAGHAG